MSDDTKQPAPDPEIPDAIKSKMSRPRRPGGFTPKSEAAEDDNAAREESEEKPIRDTAAFFKKLKVALKGPFYRIVTEVKDVKRQGEWVRETRDIRVPVALVAGEDGLPYTTEPVSAEETRKIRCMSYKDAPKMDPNTGDLTPAFVEWLYLTHPYDAAVRYAARSTHVQVAAAAKL